MDVLQGSDPTRIIGSSQLRSPLLGRDGYRNVNHGEIVN